MPASNACEGAGPDADERVDVIAPQVEDHGPILLHSFYMRFPVRRLMVEVQYWEFV